MDYSGYITMKNVYDHTPDCPSVHIQTLIEEMEKFAIKKDKNEK